MTPPSVGNLTGDPTKIGFTFKCLRGIFGRFSSFGYTVLKLASKMLNMGSFSSSG